MFKLLLCLGLLLSSVQTTLSILSHYIHIDPMNGHDTVDCYLSNSTSAACSSLDWALKNQSVGTHYLLSGGIHHLKGPVMTFENTAEIVLIGKGIPPNNTIISCSTGDTGFAFQNVTGITWVNLTISHCSSLRVSTSKNFHVFAQNGTYSVYRFPVALYFNCCADVMLDQLIIEDTPNGVGVVMYNTIGNNTIKNSVFSNNTRSATDVQPFPGGGGVYIEFTYCIVGDMNCYKNNNPTIAYNTHSEYMFHNCTFCNNVANASDAGSVNSTYIVPYRANHVAFGRGGGLSIFFKGNASDNKIFISNCTFQNNSALWGGGLFVEFHDDTYQNLVKVEDTQFMDNFCYFDTESGTAGGGMRIGHYVYGVNPISGCGNEIFVIGCHFENNAAMNGGGLSISSTVEDVQPSQVATVKLIRSTFSGNYGRLGAALHIDRFVMMVKGYILNVYVKDCIFQNNSVHYTEYIREHFGVNNNAYQTGAGAVYVNQVPLSFISKAHFCHNTGSAIAAMSTGVNFSDCVANFIRNKGNNGGAITLLGAAYLLVNRHSSLMFEKNEAIQLGGAIYNAYIEMQNLISYPNCFIRYSDYFLRPEDWTAGFYFHNNTDKGGNRISAIYTTSILPCSRASGSGISESIEVIFCWNALYWDYKPVECSKQIYSDVGKVAIKAGNESFPDFRVEAFPGHEFTLPLLIHDDLQTDIGDETVFSASFGLNTTATSFVWDKNITIPGTQSTSIPLQLDTVSERVWEVAMTVELQPCPPGFKLSHEKCVCAGHYIRAINCDIETFRANISKNNWIGKVDNSTNYFVSFCPPYYCTSVPTQLPHSSNETEIEEFLCAANHRRSIMCGECQANFEVAINSPTFQCVNCSGNIKRNIVAYVASVYIPLIALFSAIILFNIRLTTGPANAFILYSQVIAGTFDLDADGQIAVVNTIGRTTATILDDAYRVVYGIFNLQFIERFIPPLCVGELNTLDVLMAQYAVALSPLVMIIIVLVVFKLKECCFYYCGWRRRGIRDIPRLTSTKKTIASAILPAFSAFLLLSYSKFSTVSAFILLSQPLFDENGQNYGVNRVYYAGQYNIYDVRYRVYKITAYFVYCTFVAIPPLLLLDFPRRILEWAISKWDCLWRHYPADKVQILLDTFQGCYKNNMRFFAGLYFIFRLIINVIYIFTHEWFDQYLIQQVACCVMVALLSICQPYNANYKIFNVVDVLIFTNLAVINALSNYLLSQSGPLQPTIPILPLALQYILLFFPLIYMLLYLTWLLLSRKKKILLGCVQKLRISKYQHLQTLAAEFQTNNGEEECNVIGEDEALLERAQGRNLYRPYTRSEIRIDNMDRGTASVRNISAN